MSLPRPRVAGAWPKVPKPAPGDGVSVPSPWPGERWGSPVSYGLRHSGCGALRGSARGTQRLQLPKNPGILGQEEPQEGAQSFQAADTALAGSRRAELSLGTPKPGRGGVWAAPAPKEGVQLPWLAEAQPGQAPGQPEAKAGGRGRDVPRTLWAGKGPPRVSPAPGPGQDGALDASPRTPWLPGHHSADALTLLLSLPSSSPGSIKIMSRAN